MIAYLILIHGIIGGIALLAGLLSLVSKKGGRLHKMAGKFFFWSMLIGVSMALFICWYPGHENIFLFLIGVFSIYLIISGHRALGYKKKGARRLDYVVSGIMALLALAMLVLGMLVHSNAMIILLVFGGLGFVLSFSDIKIFNKPESLRQKWLTLHLSKMIGGYIAAFTAFLVVNDVLPGLISWLGPTVIGVGLIAYWVRKVKRA